MAVDKSAAVESDAKPELNELLAEWDDSPTGKRAAAAEKTGQAERKGLPAEALQEDADTDAFGGRLTPYLDRLRSLEEERGRVASDLMASRAHEDRYRERVDKFDFARFCERIEGETSLDRASIEARIKLKFAEDPEFLEAAEARYESDRFDNLADEFVEELAEQHPKVKHGSLRAAVLASRFAASGSVGDDSYGDFSKMSNQQFAEAKARVFADAASGRLKASRGRGGFFSSSP